MLFKNGNQPFFLHCKLLNEELQWSSAYSGKKIPHLAYCVFQRAMANRELDEFEVSF